MHCIYLRKEKTNGCDNIGKTRVNIDENETITAINAYLVGGMVKDLRKISDNDIDRIVFIEIITDKL